MFCLMGHHHCDVLQEARDKSFLLNLLNQVSQRESLATSLFHGDRPLTQQLRAGQDGTSPGGKLGTLMGVALTCNVGGVRLTCTVCVCVCVCVGRDQVDLYSVCVCVCV